MTYFQYIVFSVFILCCIIITYINSILMVKVRKQRDQFMSALSILLMESKHIPEQYKTDLYKDTCSLGFKMFGIHSLKLKINGRRKTA